MALPTALDDLLVSNTPAGDVARAPDLSLPGEFPEQTNERVFKDQQRARVIKGKDLAARKIPSYLDESGAVQAVRDETGAALTGFVPSRGIAFDSTGKPRKLTYGETGAPNINDDLFADIPARTDRKTGRITKVIPGIATQDVGVDPAVAAQAAFAEKAKQLSGASSSVRTLLSLEEKALKGSLQQYAERKSVLTSEIPALAELDGADEPTVAGAINSHFDSQLNRGPANKKTGWFGFGDLTEEAKSARGGLEEKRKATLATASELFRMQKQIRDRKAATETMRAQAQRLADERANVALDRLREMGIDVSDVPDALPTDPRTGERIIPPAIQRPRDANGNITGTTPQADAAEVFAKAQAAPRELTASDAWNESKVIELAPWLGDVDHFAHLAEIGAAAMRLHDDEATREDLVLLRDYQQRAMAPKGTGYQIVRGLWSLPAFALEMFFTGGIYTAGKKAATETVKGALEKVLSEKGKALIESKIAQFGIKALGATAGTLAQQIPAGGIRWTNNQIERMLPDANISENEKGELVGVITREGDDFWTAFRKAGGDTFVELLSERTGGALKFMPGADKIASLKAGLIKKWLGQNKGSTVGSFTHFLDRAGWHGVLGEMFEERTGDLMRGVGAAGEAIANGNAGEAVTRFVDEIALSPQKLIVESVTLGIPAAGIGAFNIYNTRKFNQQLSNSAQAFQHAEEVGADEPDPARAQRIAKVQDASAGFLVGQYKTAADESLDKLSGKVPLTEEDRADARELMDTAGPSLYLNQAIGESARESGTYSEEFAAIERQLEEQGVDNPDRRAAIANHSTGAALIAKTMREAAAGADITHADALDALRTAGALAFEKGTNGERNIRFSAEALQALPPKLRARLQGTPAAQPFAISAAQGTVDLHAAADAAAPTPAAILAETLRRGRASIARMAASVSPRDPAAVADNEPDIFADTAGMPSPEDLTPGQPAKPTVSGLPPGPPDENAPSVSQPPPAGQPAPVPSEGTVVRFRDDSGVEHVGTIIEGPFNWQGEEGEFEAVTIQDAAGREIVAPVDRIESAANADTPLQQSIAASKAELEQLIADPAAALSSTLNRYGVPIISADDFVARSSAMQGASVDDGQTVYMALKPTADRLRTALLEHILSTPSQTGYVEFMAGGPGSGKSTLAQSDRRLDAVYDSVFGNIASARSMIEQVLSTGRKAHITMVVRDPAEAMKANLGRALTEKRVASATGLAEAHVLARQTFKQLAAEYAGNSNVSFSAFENITGDGLRPIALADIADLNLDQTTAEAHRVLDAVANGTDSTWRLGELPRGVLAAARSSDAESRADVDGSRAGSERGSAAGDASGRPAQRDNPDALEPGTPGAVGNAEVVTEPPITLGAAGGVKIAVADTPTPDFKGKKVSSRTAIKAMFDILAAGGKTVPLRIGRYRQKAIGIWKDFAEVIRLNSANDLPTVAHEIGHGLQKVVYASVKSSALRTLPPAVKAELLKMGRALYGTRVPAAGYTSEGFAEFIRTYLTTGDAATIAPQTTAFFTTTVLPKFPKVQKAFEKAKETLDQYRAQGIRNKVSSDVVDPKSLRARLERLKAWFRPGEQRRLWIDQFEPLHALSAHASERLGRDLDVEKDPYLLASALRGVAPSRVRYMVDHSMIDYAGNPVGPSLEEALSPIRARQDEFFLYLWAEHALERWADGKDPGMEKSEAKFLVDTLGADPAFQLAAQKYYGWNAGLMSYVAQAAPTMKPIIDKLLAKFPRYVPLSRWFEPGEVKKIVFDKQSGGNASTVTKRVTKHGSGREILEPYPVILNNAEKWIELAHKSAVLDAVVKLKDVQGLGNHIEEVPKDIVGKSIAAVQIKDALEKLGVDMSGVADDTLITFFTPIAFPKDGKDPIIAHSAEETDPKTGTKEIVTRWYQVDPQLFDSLEGVNLFRFGKFFDLVLGVPARLFRLGTTGLRASFSLFTNPSRDLPTLLMQSQSKAGARKLLGAWLRSFAELWSPKRLKAFGGKTPPLVAAFNRLGLEVGQPLGADMQPRKQPHNQSIAGSILHRVENSLDALRSILSISESAPRIAEMREIAKEVGWDWEKGAPMTERQMVAIMLAAKQVTVDFSAAGSISRVVNQAVPFFNATIQGSRSFVRAWQQNPARTALRGVAMLTIPALLLWWRNKDEEWFKDMPWREKYLYFNIPMNDGSGRVLQIPRPMEWGNFFSSVPEALFDSAYREDPEAVIKSFGHIFETTVPDIMPVIPRVAKEQLQNQTDFFEAPIVPRSELERPRGEQQGPHTSAVAKWIGEAFPDTISPRRVDHITRGLIGGAAGDFMRDFEFAGRALGVIDDRENQSSDIPILGRAWRRGGEDAAASIAVEKFFDAYEEAIRRQNSIMRPEAAVDRARRLQLMDGQKAIKALTVLRQHARTLAEEQTYNRQIRKIATHYIEHAPKASVPGKPIPFAQAKAKPKEKPTGSVTRPQPFKHITDANKPRRNPVNMLHEDGF